MATLTIEIDKERDLPALRALLNRMNLNFRIDDEDNYCTDLPEAAIKGIEAGLADIKAGRVHSHEFVMAKIDKKISAHKNSNA